MILFNRVENRQLEMDFAGMCHHLITKIGAYLRITGILGSVRQCKVSPCLCLMVLFLVELPYPACEKLKIEVVFLPTRCSK